MSEESPQRIPVSQMTLDDLRDTIIGMNETARREGIFVLEGTLPDGDFSDRLFRDGMQLAIDQTDPSLVTRILTARKQTYLQQQETRLNMIIEGVASIQSGENPRLTEMKLSSYFDL